MGEIKKYTDIIRLGHNSTIGVLNEGDYITITEKIDGANASFVLNENKEIDCFSRESQVTEKETLRGYYGWIKENINPQLLNPQYRYFGEYLCSHKVKYKPEFYQKLYLFNIYDEESQEYLSDDIMRNEAERLGIKTVPLLYEGKYISFEHLMSFVGKSDMALEYGEGIVVKNVKYKNKYGRQVFVKLVHADFIEIQKQRPPKDPNKPLTAEQEFINMCLTKARVEKLLHKLVDEGVIEEGFGLEEMSIILKNLGNRVYEDIIKEESEYLPENYDVFLLRKAVGSRLPLIIRDIINS